MNSESLTKQTLNSHSSDANLLQGTGSCKVAGCGCTAFVPAATSVPHCIGKNAAGGTCNHSGDQHN